MGTLGRPDGATRVWHYAAEKSVTKYLRGDQITLTPVFNAHQRATIPPSIITYEKIGSSCLRTEGLKDANINKEGLIVSGGRVVLLAYTATTHRR